MTETIWNKKCKIPGCKHDPTTTWALVPICEMHKDLIIAEHDEHYKYKLETRSKGRRLFESIKHLTPWGKKYSAQTINLSR